MHRTRLLLVACLASVALLVPTGAVPLFDGGQGDQVSENLVMAPADGPNGAYAVLNEDGEIELSLTEANQKVAADGIGADAVTRVPRVFTITYTGDEFARVWLTDGAADVTFIGGPDAATSLEGQENAVVLGPNQTVTVGLVVDTRGDHDVESAREFTVHAEVADGKTPGATGGQDEGPDSEEVAPEETPTEATPPIEPTTVDTTEQPEGETTTSDGTDDLDGPPPATPSGAEESPTDDGPLTVPPETTGEGSIEVADAGGGPGGSGDIPGTVASGVAALAVLLLLALWRLVQ